MEVIPDKRLFWFLKEDIRLDLLEPSVLDMYIQQIITHGRTEDIKALFRDIGLMRFKEAFSRLKFFLPLEVQKFWEDFLGNN